VAPASPQRGVPNHCSGEGAQVLTVVVDHASELAAALAAQEGQPRRRRLRAGQVVLAHDAEQLAFHRGEAAVGPHAAEGAAHGVQQVQVRAVLEGVLAALQAVAPLEQRRVVAAAVVADEDAVRRQPGGKGVEHGRLARQGREIQLAHEELPTLPLGEAKHEGLGAHAAGEAGGLGVEADEALTRHRRGVRTGQVQLRGRVARPAGLHEVQAIGQARARRRRQGSALSLDRANAQQAAQLQGQRIAGRARRSVPPRLLLQHAQSLGQSHASSSSTARAKARGERSASSSAASTGPTQAGQPLRQSHSHTSANASATSCGARRNSGSLRPMPPG